MFSSNPKQAADEVISAGGVLQYFCAGSYLPHFRSLVTSDLSRVILLYNAWKISRGRPGWPPGDQWVASVEELKQLLGEILDLGDRADNFEESTRLLGSLPELDSMAVVAIITELEERYAIVIEDDDIDATTFETLGSLLDFVNIKAAA